MGLITRQSKLFGRARREAPSDAEALSHKFLTRGGFISQTASGIFSMLPLGWRVQEKIAGIIREELNSLGAQELLMPALQPSSLWAESGRLEVMDPPLFRLRDRHDKELVLASTHEEVVTDLARQNITSYKDLPQAVYQIQTKFRNEARATGGLLRVREFMMKDLYSFHRTPEDLQNFYEQVSEAYRNIFGRCDLKAHMAEANSGTIGGAVSHEFQVEAESGEDRVAVCQKCKAAFNMEVLPEGKPCAKCGAAVEVISCIESGHVFQLGTKYSDKMKAMFTEEDGSQHPLIMGCYGIGLGRLMATIAETHADEKGLKWPKSVSPYSIHVLPLQEEMLPEAEKLAQELSGKVEVLLDDRTVSAGQKFAEADLIGITTRAVLSVKNRDQGKVEATDRISGKTEFITTEELLRQAGEKI